MLELDDADDDDEALAICQQLGTRHVARHSLRMRICHVVEHNRGHNRRVLPALLA